MGQSYRVTDITVDRHHTSCTAITGLPTPQEHKQTSLMKV